MSTTQPTKYDKQYAESIVHGYAAKVRRLHLYLLSILVLFLAFLGTMLGSVLTYLEYTADSAPYIAFTAASASALGGVAVLMFRWMALRNELRQTEARYRDALGRLHVDQVSDTGYWPFFTRPIWLCFLLGILLMCTLYFAIALTRDSGLAARNRGHLKDQLVAERFSQRVLKEYEFLQNLAHGLEAKLGGEAKEPAALATLNEILRKQDPIRSMELDDVSFFDKAVDNDVVLELLKGNLAISDCSDELVTVEVQRHWRSKLLGNRENLLQLASLQNEILKKLAGRPAALGK
jgi:hypothetical protein